VARARTFEWSNRPDPIWTLSGWCATVSDLPVAAYQVSGEYSMIKAASQLGWIDEQAVTMESLVSIKARGADLILTYFTEDVLERL